MKITFKINYKSSFGQKLFIVGSLPSLGSESLEKAVELIHMGNGDWKLIVDHKGKSKKLIQYSYFIKDQNGKIIHEWGANREIEIPVTWTDDLIIQDQWRPNDVYLNNYKTSPFTEVLFKNINQGKAKKTLKKTTNVRFSINIPFDLGENSLCILGSSSQLGMWDKKSFVPMDQGPNGDFYLDINLNQQKDKLEYKYGIYNSKKKALIELEAGNNRTFDFAHNFADCKFLVNDTNFIKEFNQWKGAGVAIPVFSLRSKNSLGVGEFNDLKLMVDWSVKTGMKLIQILPINDTIAQHNWIDSYPYAAISVFALHPIYINLEKAGKLKSDINNQIIAELKKDLNSSQYIDYEKVMNSKLSYLRILHSEKVTELAKDKNYQKFVNDNSHWLKPYAAFSFLRDSYKTVEFSKWGKYSNFSQAVLDEICDENAAHFTDVEFHYFVQYHLHVQLLEATKYAHDKGVILKGDIPIGIYRNSVDAWTEPHLYNMEMQAGAPPDDFAVKGQNWGFPTYNWDEMSKDGYLWWTNRLKKLSDYFDTFRIDHILGFFRIWQIPMHAVEGILGYFNPALPIMEKEFKERGLDFSSERFCKPYIREHILLNKFGAKSDYVKSTFLLDKSNGVYQMKEEFNTQRKVENYFIIDESTSLEQKAEIDFIKKGLFDLIADIMFIEVDNGGNMEYHPRHSLQSTFSFMELDPKSKDIVNFIYNDYFYNRQEQFWKDRAMEKLPSIKNATDMLICGEDLGMVPAVVPGVMNELGILSLEVQRMPKDVGIEFFHPANAPYQSVVTCSSHDMSTVRGWWEEDYSRSQRFYNQILGHNGLAPVYADPWIIEEVVNQHLYSPAMWCILPIQDYVGIDKELRFDKADQEQINIPANIPHYWRYRFHMNLEDLIKEDKFNTKVKQMVERSSR